MFETPSWLETFLFIACAVLFILIPIRVLWASWKGESDRKAKTRELADRLKETFTDVSFSRALFSPAHVFFRHREFSVRVSFPRSGELLLWLDVEKLPSSPLVIRSNRGFQPPFALEGWSLPGRAKTGDESIVLYGPGSFGSLYRELALSPDDAHINLAESVTVISRLPGTSRFELRASRSGGFRLRLSLATDDLLYRPEHFESAVHHFVRLYEGIVLE